MANANETPNYSNLVGSLVFFKCPKRSWILGTLTSFDHAGNKGAGSASCKARKEGDEVQKLKAEDIHPASEDNLEEDVDDLLLMTELHDSTLLDCVRRRYARDVIYTNIGAIVVALNPFKYTIPAYMDDKMKNYLAEGDVIEKNVPHSWAQAHNTYYEMRNQQSNQCILVSGESGAGKTEASKIVMKYLAQVSCLTGTDADRQAAMQVGTRINLSSPPLEAFGNAKTVRNDNSSRFGKFMQVKFTAKGNLVGANITKYLLEKSRIITAATGERVYHSFYLILRSKDIRQKFELFEDKKYKSVASGGTLNNKEFDSEEEFKEVCTAMQSVGISSKSIDSMWRLLAGILHFENIEFMPDGEGAQPTAISSEFIEKGTRTWMVDRAAYEQELKETTLMIMNKPVKKLMTVSQAADARSACDKALYDCCFQWLVDQCNLLLDVDSCETWIGLLDIFGFEDFKVNSFEQLCINLTNETLQHHYNTFIFCKDLEECRAEGVDVSDVPFPDNTPCIQLLTAKGGIMALLDEECQLGSGTDMAFYEKICKTFANHPFFEVKKLVKSSFIVKHYAGDVSYEVENFREKNLDTLKDAWKILVRESGDPLIKILLPAPVDAKGPKVTVGGYFKNQLKSLMDVINSTNPHWIRCIKPHPAKKPGMFDGPQTLQQLSSSGVLGTVKIRKAGYAVRIQRDIFMNTYKIIAVAKGIKPDCEGILKALGYSKTEAQVGKKRVFLRSHVYIDIEIKRKSALSGSAKVVQGFARGACGYLEIQRNVHTIHKELIESLRAKVRKSIGFQVKERDTREKLENDEQAALSELKKHMKKSHAEAIEAEKVRHEKIRQALFAMHTAQQDDIAETEETFRRTLRSEEDEMFQNIFAKVSMSFQAASERQARREHKEAEFILMRERRGMRVVRREHEIEHTLSQSAKRLDPTFRREDKTMHAIQRQIKAREELAEKVHAQFEKEEVRAKHVDANVLNKMKNHQEKTKELQMKRWQTSQKMARSRIAFERWERVMREDFEWQKLEQQQLRGQTLAFEEQRKVFLREKSDLDRKRRQELKQEEETLRQQKLQEYRAQQEKDHQLEETRKMERFKQDRKIFDALSEFRTEVKMRERAAHQERHIAWDNDRRERMIMQRPDVPTEKIDVVPLCQRLGPPSPFVMTGNRETYTKVWVPFNVVRLEVAPSAGVGLGRPFTVSWMATRVTPSCYILVRSGAGELGRHKVKNGVGECKFIAPSEWFSELNIEFWAENAIQKETTLSKALES